MCISGQLGQDQRPAHPVVHVDVPCRGPALGGTPPRAHGEEVDVQELLAREGVAGEAMPVGQVDEGPRRGRAPGRRRAAIGTGRGRRAQVAAGPAGAGRAGARAQAAMTRAATITEDSATSHRSDARAGHRQPVAGAVEQADSHEDRGHGGHDRDRHPHRRRQLGGVPLAPAPASEPAEKGAPCQAQDAEGQVEAEVVLGEDVVPPRDRQLVQGRRRRAPEAHGGKKGDDRSRRRRGRAPGRPPGRRCLRAGGAPRRGRPAGRSGCRSSRTPAGHGADCA